MTSRRTVLAALSLIAGLAVAMRANTTATLAGTQRAVAGPSAGPLPASWTVTSPDGTTSLSIDALPTRGAQGGYGWSAARGTTVVMKGPFGVRRADQLFSSGSLRVISANTETAVTDDYQTVHGKRRVHHVQGHERTVSFANAAGARVDVILRAYDDGVAFRYRFPETDATPKTVVEELTGFAAPANSKAWIQPQQPVGMYAPAYEDLYQEVSAGAPAPTADGWALPALFHTPEGAWALVTESGMDGTYCGSHVAQNAPDGVYHVKFPDPAEGRAVGSAEPQSTLPWSLPWRVVIIANAATGILESDLVDDLSPPSRIADTSWIKPGRAAWSWWSDSDSPKHAERLNAFTDFAAEMGWEYSLVDANWNLMESGSIDDVRAHAREKNVGLLLWYNSGGPHNNVTEAPRDRMFDRDIRRAEMAKLQQWGIKGVKVDFWQSDKQDRMQQYRALLQDAADYHLLVDFHGSTIPRGWEREFPNLIGMEAVAGAEQYKFRKDYPEKAAVQNTILPFTRNVLGSMDYTPVTFTDHTYPRITTNAHELALSVVFQTPVQHLADSAQSYRAQPEAVRTFLREVPTAWDETRALSGEPGQGVIVARRDGRTWYIGGLAATTARTAHVALTFLGDAGTRRLTLIQDGASDRTYDANTRDVTVKDVVDVPMRARGGFVMRLTPQ